MTKRAKPAHSYYWRSIGFILLCRSSVLTAAIRYRDYPEFPSLERQTGCHRPFSSGV
jgi:hypothetical protein